MVILFESFGLTLIIGIILLILFFIAEWNRSTSSSITLTLILIGLIFWKGDITPIMHLLTVPNGLIYFGIGIVCVPLVFYFWGRRLATKSKFEVPDKEDRRMAALRIIITWPISLFWLVFQDLFLAIVEFGYNLVADFSEKMFNAGLNSKKPKIKP